MKFFLSKSRQVSTFLTRRIGLNSATMWSKYVSSNVWRDFTLPVSAFATVVWKTFNGKFTAKLILCYLADANIESRRTLNTLFHKYLKQMLVTFEENRMI